MTIGYQFKKYKKMTPKYRENKAITTNFMFLLLYLKKITCLGSQKVTF